MVLLITLPDEFEEHFNSDRFQDSLNRVRTDIYTNGCLAGLYEWELVDALRIAFKQCKENRREPNNENNV